MKPAKLLFICLLPMQRTLARNMPHFSYAAARAARYVFYFLPILCKVECGSWRAHLPSAPLLPLILLHMIGPLLPASRVTFDLFATLICLFVAPLEKTLLLLPHLRLRIPSSPVLIKPRYRPCDCNCSSAALGCPLVEPIRHIRVEALHGAT